jgi:predicted nucleotidyltransferase
MLPRFYASKEVIAMSFDELLQTKREDILRTASKYGAYNVRIFGSVARGEADEQSDIDFLVDMEKGRSIFDLGGLLTDLEDLLEHNVDVITEDGLRDRIRARVLKEAVAL